MTMRVNITAAIIELMAKRTRKNLKKLRGKIRFAEDYDYRAMRIGRGDYTKERTELLDSLSLEEITTLIKEKRS
jgi:hypothetical protein